jgi:hypothetical protein
MVDTKAAPKPKRERKIKGKVEIDIEKCFLGIIKKMLNSIQMSDDQRNELIHHLNEQI